MPSPASPTFASNAMNVPVASRIHPEYAHKKPALILIPENLNLLPSGRSLLQSLPQEILIGILEHLLEPRPVLKECPFQYSDFEPQEPGPPLDDSMNFALSCKAILSAATRCRASEPLNYKASLSGPQALGPKLLKYCACCDSRWMLGGYHSKAENWMTSSNLTTAGAALSHTLALFPLRWWCPGRKPLPSPDAAVVKGVHMERKRLEKFEDEISWRSGKDSLGEWLMSVDRIAIFDGNGGAEDVQAPI
ncbi:MAG: hypothetical protein Q9227_007995 [Pyrenula ochraceoflavens]